jgi:hypothetical protein
MGKSTISMAIFNSYVKLPEGILKETFLGHMFANILFFNAHIKNTLGTICQNKLHTAY